MKKILLTALMVLMTAISMNAETTVDELCNDIERLQHKIAVNKPKYLNGVYIGETTLETAKANIETWKKRIDDKFSQIVELVKRENKEVDRVEFNFETYDILYENYDGYKHTMFTIYYADGTKELNMVSYTF